MPCLPRLGAPGFSASVRMRRCAAILLAGVAIGGCAGSDGGAHWSDPGYHQVVALRAQPLPSLAVVGSTPIDLKADHTPHAIYIFRLGCSVCETQRHHVGDLLAGLPAGAVISAAVESAGMADSIADYWSSIDVKLPRPVVVDSAWLRRQGISEIPILIFVSPGGLILKGVAGSIMSWVPMTPVKDLKLAAVADATFRKPPVPPTENPPATPAAPRSRDTTPRTVLR